MRILNVGDVVRKELPYSEVCEYMGIAGQVFDVEIKNDWIVQLTDIETGKPFSFGITFGEAGIYTDSNGKPFVDANMISV